MITFNLMFKDFSGKTVMTDPKRKFAVDIEQRKDCASRQE